MTQSIKKTLQEINAMPKDMFGQRDNREAGAIWPTHNEQDLENTDWFVKNYE